MNVTSICQSDPGKKHWIAVKNSLKYLRRTKDLFLVFGRRSELKVEGCTHIDDRKSTSEYVQWWFSKLEEFQTTDHYRFYLRS